MKKYNFAEDESNTAGSNINSPMGILALGEALERIVEAGSCHESVRVACKLQEGACRIDGHGGGGGRYGKGDDNDNLWWLVNSADEGDIVGAIDDLQFQVNYVPSWDESTIMTAPSLRSALNRQRNGKARNQIVFTGDKKLLVSDPKLYHLLNKANSKKKGNSSSSPSDNDSSVLKAPSRTHTGRGNHNNNSKVVSKKERIRHNHPHRSRIQMVDSSGESRADPSLKLLSKAMSRSRDEQQEKLLSTLSLTEGKEGQHSRQVTSYPAAAAANDVKSKKFPPPRPPEKRNKRIILQNTGSSVATPTISTVQQQQQQDPDSPSNCSPVSVSKFPSPLPPPTTATTTARKSKHSSSSDDQSQPKHYLVKVKSVQEVDLKPTNYGEYGGVCSSDECFNIEIDEDGQVIQNYEERGFEFQERYESRRI